MATKSLGKDLKATQTWLNEKLLEVNICLSCVFSGMFSNYKAAGRLSIEYAASSNQKNLTSAAMMTLLYLTDTGVEVISCLFRKLN